MRVGAAVLRPYTLTLMFFLLHLMSVIAIALPAQLGYTFVFGRGKILHFGPIGVSVVAAYGTFLTLNATGSFILGLCIGVLMAILFSLLFAWLSFRLDPDGLGVMSIAVYLTLFTIVLNWSELTRGALGLPRIPRLPFAESALSFTIVTSTICIAWVLFFLWLDRTKLARQVSALAEGEWYAKAMGISRVRAHLIAFLILGLTLASDNFFYAQYYHLLHPSDYYFPAFVSLLMITVAGKPGSTAGAIVATILLTVLKEGVRFLPFPTEVLGPLRLMLFGIILLAAVWIQRDTLFPKKRTI